MREPRRATWNNPKGSAGAGIAVGLGAASQGVLGQESGNQQQGPPPLRWKAERWLATLQAPVQERTTFDGGLNYKSRAGSTKQSNCGRRPADLLRWIGPGPGVDPYAQGVRMARTYMDAINVEMEHGALDFMQLREFMRGLVDGVQPEADTALRGSSSKPALSRSTRIT